MATTIIIKHRIIKGKRNLQERVRVGDINKYIGGLLWNVFGLETKEVEFNGLDKWNINQDLPTLPQKLYRFPTVTVTVQN
jgi:hypothetical protein